MINDWSYHQCCRPPRKRKVGTWLWIFLTVKHFGIFSVSFSIFLYPYCIKWILNEVSFLCFSFLIVLHFLYQMNIEGCFISILFYPESIGWIFKDVFLPWLYPVNIYVYFSTLTVSDEYLSMFFYLDCILWRPWTSSSGMQKAGGP